MSKRIDRYAAMPKLVAQLLVEANGERFDAAPRGEWSARQVITHLRDVELFSNRLRFERMLAEVSPVFTVFDQAAWNARRVGALERKEALLAEFALHRQATISLLRGFAPRDWEQTGTHPTRGVFTASTWLDACLEHDAEHLVQLEALVGETVEEAIRRRARREWR